MVASSRATDASYTSLFYHLVSSLSVEVICRLLKLPEVGFVYLNVLFGPKFKGFDDMKAKQPKIFPDCGNGNTC